ncbi:Coenzyme F420 hydrogenase/dehydrogenase, beta subunit C-terminal domain, partial [Mediterraneibacter glycyrrhizinilyticus]|nr:Coenzyme F420 hydrogenase/dehydrogenase, beta subunit C-terminal domain [Mediterraneibacter glycyrrhizinilyticus]
MAYLKSDEILGSSSGGTFYGIATKAIELGYEVCGCIWNEEQRAIHVFANDIETLAKMQGSKYVQSDLQNCYTEIQNKLMEGKKVLFSGTPCQIAGLHRLIGYDENLVTLGLICEGTPSPLVFKRWKEYLEEKYGSNIISVKLRKKGRYGWKSP